MFLASLASLRMSSFWALIILSITFTSYTIEAKDTMELPSAVIVGAVQCDTCIKQSSREANRFIAGASVAVKCASPIFHHVVTTNKSGNFMVHLPFSVEADLKQVKKCAVELISSNELLCTMAANTRAMSSSLHLQSRQGGKYIFSAGVLKFKPMKRPEICDQKPTSVSLKNVKKVLATANPLDTLPPAVQDSKVNPMNFGDYVPHLPELPKLPPLPALPRLPQLPQIPFLHPVPRFGFPFFHPIPSRPENTLTRPVFIPQFPFQKVPGFPGVSSQSKTKSP